MSIVNDPLILLIDHNLLLAKLCRYGSDSQPHKWIDSYLKDRHQRVEIDGVLSSPAIIQSGVPQRSIMGPLLFILYINDLPRVSLMTSKNKDYIYWPIRSRREVLITVKKLKCTYLVRDW